MQGKISEDAKLGKHDISHVVQSTSFKTSNKSTHLTDRIWEWKNKHTLF